MRTSLKKSRGPFVLALLSVVCAMLWSRLPSHTQPLMLVTSKFAVLTDRSGGISVVWWTGSMEQAWFVYWVGGFPLRIKFSGQASPVCEVAQDYALQPTQHDWLPRANPSRIRNTSTTFEMGGATTTKTLAIQAYFVPLWWVSPVLAIIAWFVRRRLSMRGNRCVQCGYSKVGLAADAVCPECGRSAAATATS
jgi:hypothetical protein